MRPAPFLRALEHRNFRLFLFGQGISLIGTWMQQVALSWVVFQRTGSASLLGVVTFAGQIPGLVITPLDSGEDSERGGMRFPRNRMGLC